MKVCKIIGCESPPHGHGWCKGHWRRWRRHGDPLAGRQVIQGASIEDRFWAKVDRSGGCWVWTGAHNGRGYGTMGIREGGSQRMQYAHRLSYEMAHGPIPDGYEVCHRCDNPPCVKPEHLFIGTRQDNERDKMRKGRTLRGSAVATSKLTESVVLQIRAEAAAGTMQRRLAERYSVSPMTISLIVRHKTWRAVA